MEELRELPQIHPARLASSVLRWLKLAAHQLNLLLLNPQHTLVSQDDLPDLDWPRQQIRAEMSASAASIP
jgi:hypothetical protein